MFSFYIYIAYFLPLPDFLNVSGGSTTKIYDRKGVLLYEVIKPELGKRSIIPLEKIPRSMIDATLASEDINFYSHPGVDVLAIMRAIFFNFQEGRVVSGASTITQQLVRNMIGTTRRRDFWDKTLEAVYAVRISNVYSKNQILELYLNTVYYGNMAYGIESAAESYFGKHVYDLDLAQITFIAGLPQSPSRYDPYVSFESAKQRQRYVLNQMEKHGFILGQDNEAAYAEPIKLRANKYLMKAPHFVHYVINQLESIYGEDALLYGGLKITTTLDYDLQLEAERIVKMYMERLENHNVNNGALLAMDTYSGQILVWVGSADYFNNDIDGAVDMVTALRQPGSSIKPFNYLLAFEKGYTPATVIYDVPTQFSTASGPYSPKNYDLDYHGPVRVRTALASSYNIPAVKTLEFAGVNNFITFLGKMGINTLKNSADHYGLALTLGGGEVRLLDMAEAYNVIANLGDKFDQSVVLEVKDNDSNVIYEWEKPEGVYILGDRGREHAYQIIDILKDNNARLPGFGDGSVLNIDYEAAVKTGTTRNFRDNWTIGFSPNLLTAVWVGNADAGAMENVSGIDGAAPIWADFMETALQFSPKRFFLAPDSLIEVEICALSGKLPTAECADRVFELFDKENAPTQQDDYFIKYWVNKVNGKIVEAECAKSYDSSLLEQKVLVTYPAELQKWAVEKGLNLPPYEPCPGSYGYSNTYTNGYADGNSASIFLDSPANNDEYLIDTILPLNDQRIPLRVTVPHETIKVTFYIDGITLATQTEHPFTYLWEPKKGKHNLKAEAELIGGRKIESDTVSFSIN